MVAYLDSSVALRHILRGEEGIQEAFEASKVYSSELLEVECRRVIHRCRMEGALDDLRLVSAMDRLSALLAGVNLLSLSGSVKRRAMEAFPVVVKTLDALHLASALVLAASLEEEAVAVFTHDRSMNRCARALGLQAPFSDS